MQFPVPRPFWGRVRPQVSHLFDGIRLTSLRSSPGTSSDLLLRPFSRLYVRFSSPRCHQYWCFKVIQIQLVCFRLNSDQDFRRFSSKVVLCFPLCSERKECQARLVYTGPMTFFVTSTIAKTEIDAWGVSSTVYHL